VDQHSDGQDRDEKNRASAGLQAATENKGQALIRIAGPPSNRYRYIPQQQAKQLMQHKRPNSLALLQGMAKNRLTILKTIDCPVWLAIAAQP